MNYLLKILFSIFFVVVTFIQQNLAQENIFFFYVGTYTNEGIFRYGIDNLTGKLYSDGLAATSINPSFLALSQDKRYLLAVQETHDSANHFMGKVESFEILENGKLSLVNRVSSGGADPCFVAVNQEGLILAANYSGGSVATFQLENDGWLSEALDVVNHYGSGPNSARQESPHVHSAYFEPGGDRIFVVDLGTDQVNVYVAEQESGKLRPFKNPGIAISPGSGPRHLAFHPNGRFLYVVNELTSSVTVVEVFKKGGFGLVETVSALPEKYSDENTCADIHFSPDGRFLYVSNRGLNSIAIFQVDRKSGKLLQVGQEATRGVMPRNFVISPDGKFLLVANQKTDNIVSFRRDENTGQLTFLDEIAATKPVCLLFY